MELGTVDLLIIAFVLDLLLGDPRWLPHLIIFYGKLIAFGEKKMNTGEHKFWQGAILTTVLVSGAFLIPSLIKEVLHDFNQYTFSSIFSVLMLFYCLANKTLIEEGKAVFVELEKGIEEGRKRLSWIVGRDTSTLNEQQIRKATFETMSENLSDGVIAPIFYFFLFGIPGAMAYKMINTLDSMIGYKNERYEQFGKFAAILDDVANYIPSRITALLMLLVSFKWGGVSFVFREGKKHSSPNAGYPEAALAYILSCQFGGPNYYHGSLIEKPFIGSDQREIKQDEIKKVVRINYSVSIFSVTSLTLGTLIYVIW